MCVFALCLSVSQKVVLSTWPFSCCCDLYIRYPYFRLLSPQGDTTLLPLPLSLSTLHDQAERAEMQSAAAGKVMSVCC